MAQTMVILLGGIDLSAGSVVSLANAICATTMQESRYGFLLGTILAVLSGIVVGGMNGVLIAKGRLQAIVVTLATQSLIAGFALAILPVPGGFVHETFGRFIGGSLQGFRFIPFVIGIVLIIMMWLVLNRTRYGRNVMATGGNEDAAYNSGVNTTRIKIVTFTLCGLLSALAGIFIAARIRTGDPLIGIRFTENSIAVTVLGGTSLSGGRGGIVGTVAGVFILIIINNILNLIGIPSFYQYIALGIILIMALTLSAVKKNGG
jgi:ribose/xylose/arabinose/galactoside ABC-type transport system permease subunit